MSYIALVFLGYILYKFVFGFILPVYKATKQVKNQFSNMQQKVKEQFNDFTNTTTETKESSTNTASKNVKKEYIDFEEVE